MGCGLSGSFFLGAVSAIPVHSSSRFWIEAVTLDWEGIFR
jgi:hypothetical protein